MLFVVDKATIHVFHSDATLGAMVDTLDYGLPVSEFNEHILGDPKINGKATIKIYCVERKKLAHVINN